MEFEKKVCPDCNGSGVYQEYDEYDRYTVHSCATCDGSGEIARQSVTSEEVQEAIEYLQPLTEHPIMSGNFAKHIKTAITALQAYQPWIPVSEGKRTTQWYQEMCELIEAIESEYQGKKQQEIKKMHRRKQYEDYKHTD